MKRLLLLFLVLTGTLLLFEGGHPFTPADGPAEIPETRNYVALTFDDGPKSGTTERLLDGLKERGVTATFSSSASRLRPTRSWFPGWRRRATS